MPKRKFSEHVRGQKSTTEELFSRAIEHGQKLLFRALKVARGFEQQKLGRRRKEATQKKSCDEQKTRLADEVTALKVPAPPLAFAPSSAAVFLFSMLTIRLQDLDLNAVAGFYLRRTLARTTSIVAAPDFPEALREWAKKPSPFLGTAVANVTARLFKAAPVRAAMEDVLRAAKRALGLEKKGSRAVEATGKSARETTEARGEGTLNGHAEDEKRGRVWSGSLASQSDRASSRGSEASMSRFDQYMARMAHTSDDGETGDQPGGEISHDTDVRTEGLVTDDEEELSVEGGVSLPPNAVSNEASEHSSSQTDDSPQRSPPTRAQPARPTSTTFLPSLTMGGYISGSDSASIASDIDAAGAELRKNRRGQRARRAIWEKKFGAQAKHVQHDTDGRDLGWDAKRGATEARSVAKSARKRVEPKQPRNRKERRALEKRQGVKLAANGSSKGDMAPKRMRDDEGKLHASWEAAKKAKADKQKVAFAGKKIVFD